MTNRELLDSVITDVYKHCAENDISIRQFLLSIGQNKVYTFYTLQKSIPDFGQLGLLLTLLNYFNYGKN